MRPIAVKVVYLNREIDEANTNRKKNIFRYIFTMKPHKSCGKREFDLERTFLNSFNHDYEIKRYYRLTNTGELHSFFHGFGKAKLNADENQKSGVNKGEGP